MRRGFTLIELMTVIVIVSITCAVIAPVFLSNVGSQELSAAAWRVSDLVNLCRSTAVFEGRRVRLEPVPGRNALVMTIEKERDVFEPRDAGGMGLAELPESVRLMRVAWLSLEEETDEAPAGIRFHPDGSVEDVALVFGNTEGERTTIVIAGLTGRQEVREGDATRAE